MQECGKANASLYGVPGVWLRESLAFLVIAAQFESAFEQFVHSHFFVDHLAHGKRLALVNEIAAAQLFRREADDGGHPIEMAFEREDALRRAETAKGPVRRSIGGHHTALNQNVWASVRPGGVNRAARQHHW